MAVVARGPAAYCMRCNDILDWAEVIAVVQGAAEPETSASAHETAVVAAIPTTESDAPEPAVAIRREVVAPALSMPGPDTGEPDPFSQRLR